jgi:hypothetical protein
MKWPKNLFGSDWLYIKMGLASMMLYSVFRHNHPVNWDSENAIFNFLNNISILFFSFYGIRYLFVSWVSQEDESSKALFKSLQRQTFIDSMAIWLLFGGFYIIGCCFGLDLSLKGD